MYRLKVTEKYTDEYLAHIKGYKYIKRTGSPGHYKYVYPSDTKQKIGASMQDIYNQQVNNSSENSSANPEKPSSMQDMYNQQVNNSSKNSSANSEKSSTIPPDWYVKDPVPHENTIYSRHSDMRAVNKGGVNLKPGRGTNCMYCSTAYELRRRGYDVQARQDWMGGMPYEMPEKLFKGAKREYVYDLSSEPGYKPMYESQYLSDKYTKAAAKKLRETVEAQGEGARGQVTVTWQGGSGHSMAYEVVDGKMHLIDCQTSEDMTGNDIWEKRLRTAEKCEIVRTDNCEIDPNACNMLVEKKGGKDYKNWLDMFTKSPVDKAQQGATNFMNKVLPTEFFSNGKSRSPLTRKLRNLQQTMKFNISNAKSRTKKSAKSFINKFLKRG